MDNYVDIRNFSRIRILKWIVYTDIKYKYDIVGIRRIRIIRVKKRIYPSGYYPFKYVE